MAPKITVVGSFAVGMTIRTPSLPVFGQTLLGSDFDMGPGGKGSNQAVAAARLGADAALIDLRRGYHGEGAPIGTRGNGGKPAGQHDAVQHHRRAGLGMSGQRDMNGQRGEGGKNCDRPDASEGHRRGLSNAMPHTWRPANCRMA